MLFSSSLTPQVLYLSQFFTDNFPNFWWYPNWYLGSPFNYLIGPVVPITLGILNKLFFISVAQSYPGLIYASIIASASGLYFLIKQLNSGRAHAFFSSVLFFSLFTFHFSLFTLSNGLVYISWGILPWVFLLFTKFLHKPSRKQSIFLTIAISFILLIDIMIFLPLVVGFTSLAIILRAKREVSLEYLIIKSTIIIFTSLAISTIWYSPGYWLTLLNNPSFGGMPLINLIKFLYQLLLHLLPLVAAVAVVKFQKIKLSPQMYFAILFTSSFLFLTFLRFLSDPDFIEDWLGFLIELGFGFSIIGGVVILKLRKFTQALVCIIFIIIIIVILKKPGFDRKASSYQDQIASLLKDHVKDNERVFLSGSPVFFMDIPQVRGGVDQASYHPFWAHGAYQIREGESPQLAGDWLKAFGASYILVHDSKSEELYRDFKNFDKFQSLQKLKLLKTLNGDRLYQVEGASIARVVDKWILQIKKPKDGADKKTLGEYTQTFKRPLSLARGRLANQIMIGADLKGGELISLAITYHPNWQIVQGKGDLKADSLGNMVIIPEKAGDQQFSLEYKVRIWEWLVPGLLSMILILVLINYDKLYLKLDKEPD